MKSKLLITLIGVVAIQFCSADTLDDKIKAYNMISEALPKLESQLELVKSSIAVAEEKISKNSSSPRVQELFKSQLEKLEDQKESVLEKIDQLNAILVELKNDPEVGGLIEGEESTREMKQKLDRASSALSEVNN